MVDLHGQSMAAKRHLALKVAGTILLQVPPLPGNQRALQNAHIPDKKGMAGEVPESSLALVGPLIKTGLMLLQRLRRSVH